MEISPDYLNKFKIAPPSETLFDLDMRDAWKTGRCVYCGVKLRITRTGSAFCPSKKGKHKKFFIKKFK